MRGRAMMMNQNNNNRFRQRFMPGMFPGMQNNNNNNNNQPAVVYKQYVRVGEVMANGYKLESVTRTSAVLTKGSERMELTIVEASQNAGGRSNTSNSNRNNNPFRMSPQQMRQWMQMMGGGRNNMGNWNRGGRNNNNNRNSMGNRR
jgi:hypothetical protein